MTELPRQDRLITIVCTDRGQHPRRRIAFTSGSNPVPAGGAGIEQQRRGGARWHCSTCGRTVELTRDNWLRLRDGMRRAGEHTADMSFLPGV